MAGIQHLFPFRPAVIAHRGANRQAPENTLAAFREAVRQGAVAIELDVRLSRDNVPVVIHDPTVDRTTNGRGRVCDQSLASLKELDAGVRLAGQFAGEKIPTLEEVFEAIPAPIWINVELKKDGARENDLECRVVELIQRLRVSQRVLLSSLSVVALLQAGRRGPEIPCAILTKNQQPLPWRRAWLALLVRHEVCQVQLAQVSEALVERAHRGGRLVTAWVANAPEEIRRLAGWKVDGIVTDVPEVAVSLVSRTTAGASRAAG